MATRARTRKRAPNISCQMLLGAALALVALITLTTRVGTTDGGIPGISRARGEKSSTTTVQESVPSTTDEVTTSDTPAESPSATDDESKADTPTESPSGVDGESNGDSSTDRSATTDDDSKADGSHRQRGDRRGGCGEHGRSDERSDDASGSADTTGSTAAA